MRARILLLILCLGSCYLSPEAHAALKRLSADVCVYGGTASGIAAAVTAHRQGCSVLIVEPSRWLGGIIGGGIRINTDGEYDDHVGGFTAEVLKMDKEFGIPDVLRAQKKTREMWARLVAENKIEVVYEHRLGKVEKDGRKVTALVLDYAPPERDGCPAAQPQRRDDLRVEAKIFIDTSYEGDLMAGAGVRYALGRESAKQYGESLAGVRNVRVFAGVDPYIKPGVPESGLLPGIDPGPLGNPGDASPYPMAYNFRLIWKGNDGQPVLGPPEPADPARYELARRAAGNRKAMGWPTDNYSRGALISGGPAGAQKDYPDGDWATRARIWRQFINQDKALCEITGKPLHLDLNEYPDTGGWPHQLYVRVGRRMLGRYVVTQADLAHQTEVNDSIGLAYYCVDIYPCRMVVAPDGKSVASEGEVWELVSPGPYRIPYRALTPKAGECENLLVPVCLSASHVAYSSIRMEPTYMVMGEAAGVAAAEALREKTSVQGVDLGRLRQALRADGQILEWNGKGYGTKFWGKGFNAWWQKHPEEYLKNPPYMIPKKGYSS